MRSKDTQRIVFSGMFIALVTVMTFINVPYPGSVGGLMHLGTLMLFIIALKFGKQYGALAGGIGMFLFDLFGGYTTWMFGTLVVRLAMGFVVGWISEDENGQGTNLTKNIIAIIAGALVMLFGYYVYEATFLTTFYTAFASIPGNLAQIVIGLISLIVLKYVPDLIED